MTIYKGGCHCGNISVRLTTKRALTALVPRACDCSFCTCHSAEWISTPCARLELTIQNEAALNLYEQGSGSARLWLCQRCGVVAAVTCDISGKRKGAVNRRVLEDKADFPPAVPTSPEALSAEEKKKRWEKLWINDVIIKDCWDAS